MDSGTCSAPSGEQYNSFGLSPKTLALIVAPIIACLPAFVIWGIPAIWMWVGMVSGGYLRRKTEGRRGQVLKSIEEDEKVYAEKHEQKGGGDQKKGEQDEGWEKVQTCSAPSTPDGNKLADDWAGIVGIFHPFWYVFQDDILPQCWTDIVQQCWRWWRESSLGCYPSYPGKISQGSHYCLHW